MNDIKRKITLLDGAMGTNLVNSGMQAGSCVEEWVLGHSDVVVSLQKKYIEAGSRIIYAPTFGANPVMLKKYGDLDCASVNKRLMALSKTAAGDSGVLIAGDLSSTGLLPRPYGDAGYDEIYSAFKEQARSLEEAGADLFVIETSSTLFEAAAALDAVRDVSDKKVFVSFTVGKTGRTLAGDDIRCCLVALQERGADAFGVNCSEGEESVYNAIRSISPLAKIPLMAKPNAGIPEVKDGKLYFSGDPENFAEWGERFAKAGVSYLGGCCGTDPRYIAALAAMLEKRDSSGDDATGTDETEYVCSSSALFDIGKITRLPEPVVCDEELMFNAPSEDEADVCRIFIESAEQADNLAEACPAIELPVMLGGSFDCIVAGIKNYVGRCIIDPDSDLSKEEKNILKTKYGCAIL